jgi:hypothetical protein
MSNWSQSGNGKDNLASNGEDTAIIRFKGVEYANDLEEYGEDEDKEDKFVDNDRFSYCGGWLADLFFWGMTDLHGLASFLVQNVRKVGASTHSGAGGQSTSGISSAVRDKKGKVGNIVKQIEESHQHMMTRFMDQIERSDLRAQVHGMKTSILNVDQRAYEM